MCLKRDLINNPLCHANKEITCYKVVSIPYELRNKLKTKLLRLFGKFDHYETYYENVPITIGTIACAQPAYTKWQLESIERIATSLGAGFIHSYKHKEDAIKFIKTRSRHTVTALVECTIPVGAYYFEGTGGWSQEEHYASTALKYVKIIKP